MSGSRISAEIPDWRREIIRPGVYEPGRRLLSVIRRYQRAGKGMGGFLLMKRLVLEHRFWSAVCGADIPLDAHLEGGLLLPHPNGVVIHPLAQIGPNCLLFQQVTVGTGPLPGVPRIGGHVDVGAGAKILGGVRIGDHARIGAGAVVVKDVPEGAVATGVPACVRRDGK